jgi:hypothetical protein
MPNLSGLAPPVIISSVCKIDFGGNELLRCGIVQGRDLHRDKITTQFLQVSTTERADAAVTTEQEVNGLATVLVIAERIFPREQAKGVGLHHGAPASILGTHGTVALACAGAQVDVRLEAHRSAMTATLVRLQHDSGSSSESDL